MGRPPMFLPRYTWSSHRPRLPCCPPKNLPNYEAYRRNHLLDGTIDPLFPWIVCLQLLAEAPTVMFAYVIGGSAASTARSTRSRDGWWSSILSRSMVPS